MALDYEYMAPSDRAHAEQADSGPSGAAKFKALRGPVGIRRGAQVANQVADQRAVMDMLDKLKVDFGGNRRLDGTVEVNWPPPVEGKCHAVLHGKILQVQAFFHGKGLLGFAPDGVIDPGGRTQQLIQANTGHDQPFPASDPKELARAAIPLALRWIKGASDYLGRYKSWRMARQAFPFDATAANTHLHLNLLGDTDSLPRVEEWLQNYRLLAGALTDADRVFVRATREQALAEINGMKCWGGYVPAWARYNQHIWFGPDMLGLGMNCRAAILLHEGGHYIRQKIGHQGGERGPAYDSQSADQALTSAYVCANFATHATTGRDERFGLARKGE